MENLDSPEGYDLYAPHYRKDHAYLDSFDWAVAGVWWKEALNRLRATVDSVTVLDAGCGDGRTLSRCAKHLLTLPPPRCRLQAFDSSPEMVRLALRKAPGATVETMDLESATGRKDWVDHHGRAHLLSAFFLLVHVRRPADFFSALAELAHPGSQLLMNSIPQRKPPVLQAGARRFTIQSYHHQARSVREAALDSGWHLVREQDVTEDTNLVSTVYWWTR